MRRGRVNRTSQRPAQMDDEAVLRALKEALATYEQSQAATDISKLVTPSRETSAEPPRSWSYPLTLVLKG